MPVREGYYSEQVRNKALESVLETLSKRQRDVFVVISKWQPISNERIAEHLGCALHTVTPRTLELREMGFVEFAGEGVSETSNRKVSLWKINKDGKQMSLF